MACTNPVRLQKDFSISSLKATELKVSVAQCKGIQDTFGFWIPDSGYSILDSFSVGLGFRIPWVVFRIPKSRIPDSTNKNFPDSGISISLHEAIPGFLIFVEWCEVQCICKYFSWQLLIKTFLLHCPQQIQFFSLDARKTEQKSKLRDRLGLRRGEIKSD